jgi:hypothetical protein
VIRRDAAFGALTWRVLNVPGLRLQYQGGPRKSFNDEDDDI